MAVIVCGGEGRVGRFRVGDRGGIDGVGAGTVRRAKEGGANEHGYAKEQKDFVQEGKSIVSCHRRLCLGTPVVCRRYNITEGGWTITIALGQGILSKAVRLANHGGIRQNTIRFIII